MVTLWSQLVGVLVEVAVLAFWIVCTNIISMLFPVRVDGYYYLWFRFCVERSESGICSSPVGIEVWTTTVSNSGPRFGPCMKGNESCRMFSSISNSDSLRTVFSERSLAVEINKSRVLMHSSGTTSNYLKGLFKQVAHHIWPLGSQDSGEAVPQIPVQICPSTFLWTSRRVWARPCCSSSYSADWHQTCCPPHERRSTRGRSAWSTFVGSPVPRDLLENRFKASFTPAQVLTCHVVTTEICLANNRRIAAQVYSLQGRSFCCVFNYQLCWHPVGFDHSVNNECTAERP